jgi:hypothetical protein
MRGDRGHAEPRLARARRESSDGWRTDSPDTRYRPLFPRLEEEDRALTSRPRSPLCELLRARKAPNRALGIESMGPPKVLVKRGTGLLGCHTPDTRHDPVAHTHQIAFPRRKILRSPSRADAGRGATTRGLARPPRFPRVEMPEDGRPPAIGLPIAFFLVLVNGFFVAAEFAIVKVRGTRLLELAAAGSDTARQAQFIVGRLDSYLAATQLGITMAGLGLGWIGEPAVASVLEPPAARWRRAIGRGGRGYRLRTRVRLITLFHITLGELAPEVDRDPSTGHDNARRGLAAADLRDNHLARDRRSERNGQPHAPGRRPAAASESELAHSEEELRLILASSATTPVHAQAQIEGLDLRQRCGDDRRVCHKPPRPYSGARRADRGRRMRDRRRPRDRPSVED